MTAEASSQLPLFEEPGAAESPPASPGRPRRRRCSPPMQLCVLGSGSGGNSTVLRCRGRTLLLDAGFGPATIDHRLRQAKVEPESIEAICLTHLDRDHCRPSWLAAARERGIRVFAHHWHLPDLHASDAGAALLNAGLVEPIGDEPIKPLPGLVAHARRVQHDQQGTLAFRLTDHKAALGYATDLGHVPPALIEHFAGVDVLCLEANYDPEMTRNNARPTFVNRRNMASSGHLSNRQALDAAQRIADRSPHDRPERLVLLHRSSECNHPTTVRRTFEQDPALARRVILTDQRRRSRWIPVRPVPPMRRAQLTLAR